MVLKTLEFDSPLRIPRQLWILPWAQNNYPQELARIQERFPDDIISTPGFYSLQPKTTGDAYSTGNYIDEWGCEFENKQDGIIGEVKRPLIGSWSDMSKLKEPDELLSVNIEAVNDFCCNTEKFVMAGTCPRPFERLQFLRGTENVMMDIAMHSSECADLLDRIHQFHLKELQIWVQTDVDGLMFMDDWGAQRSLLISPDMWRELFKPLYREYIEIAHRHGKKIFMHSDGFIIDIIPDLIELGLDALNSQIFCMEIRELGDRFKGKITFWGEIDRQDLLPNGEPKQISEAVQLIYDSLYCNGGVIAQMEFGPGAKPENVEAAFESWNNVMTVS
jgi:uroporphyrinogen-III decarboxylase